MTNERKAEIENQAKEMLQDMTIKGIIDAFDAMIGVTIAESATVRGWLMDELERRNPEKFEQFLDSSEESPRSFFLG